MDSGTTKNIVDHAFPPLGALASPTPLLSTTRRNSIYGLSYEARESEFGILDELKLGKLQKSSLSWAYPPSPFASETDIHLAVLLALRDCIMAAKLDTIINIRNKVALSAGHLMGHRADTAVFVNKTSTIASVGEIKRPKCDNMTSSGSKQKKRARRTTNNIVGLMGRVPEPVTESAIVTFDMSQIAQIADYMVDTRNYFRVRFVFAILTTYEEWKILWLEDTDDAAQATTMENYETLCLEGSANGRSICWEGDAKDPKVKKVTIYHTRVYKHSDPQLIEVLASFLYKVSKTPIHLPRQFIDEMNQSSYIFATATGMAYKRLPKTLKFFKYDTPPTTVKSLFILSYFHRGGDGRVALCSCKEGSLTVIKFLIDPQDQVANLEEEAAFWETLWGVKCRLLTLNNRPGLLMPFCLTFSPNLKDKNGSRNEWFASLSLWNKLWPQPLLSDLSPINEIKGKINKAMLEKYQENPLLAAEQALSVLCEKRIQHEDLSLRHLALLPQFNKESKDYDLKPVLIDLTRVSECEGDPGEYYQRCMARLTLELEHIVNPHPEQLSVI